VLPFARSLRPGRLRGVSCILLEAPSNPSRWDRPRSGISVAEEADVNFRLLMQLFITLCLWPAAGMADLEAGLAAYARADYETALREIRPSAEQGNARAQSRLGTMYMNGEGVQKDTREGVRWYRKAAEQGFLNAQFNLGIAYGSGRGVAKDDSKAARWYRLAAEQGDAEAQATLGAMYTMGIGVRRDNGKALRWYREATDQGYAEAQAALGAMYQRGNGVPKDSAAAAGWYRKAAAQGVAEAQWLLGRMYADGEGVPQDDVQAYAWMAISGMGRMEFSRSIFDALRERMTSSQVEAARKLFNEYAAKALP